MAIKPHWTLVRTFVAQAPEGHAALPAAAGFVAVDGPIDEDVELSFGHNAINPAALGNPIAMGGGLSGELWVWALHDDGTITVEEVLAKIILAFADSPVFVPVIVRPGQSKIYVTWDSSNPAGNLLAGSVHARRVGK